MDCRRTLALALVVGTAGCTVSKTLPTTASGEQVAVEVRKERDLPKRKPQASTCVAFGAISEQTAADPKRPPVERDQMRERARKAYQQALDIDPKNRSALTGLARLYDEQGDHERAVDTFRKAAKAHPKEASAWFDLGMCHARHKEWEPALENLRKAVEGEPGNRQYSNAYGFCLARAGRYEESLAAFRKVGGDAEAHYNLARMLHHVKEEELSKQHVQLALHLSPGMTPAQELLAELEGRVPAAAQMALEGQVPAATVDPAVRQAGVQPGEAAVPTPQP
jgi:tetratricopeptide (TPR) repeat protein